MPIDILNIVLLSGGIRIANWMIRIPINRDSIIPIHHKKDRGAIVIAKFNFTQNLLNSSFKTFACSIKLEIKSSE